MTSPYGLLLFLLSAVVVVTVTIVEGKEGCSPSSCGPVRSISYPFRLRDDPANCGDPNFEITCNSNNNEAVLEISSSKYLVTDISYENATVHVVGAGFATGTCSSSSLSLSARYPQSRYYTVVGQAAVATFVNCSEKIQKDRYRPIPCLSQQKNNSSSFVYVTSGASVGDIAQFCSFSSMVPTPYNITSQEEVLDVFQALDLLPTRNFQCFFYNIGYEKASLHPSLLLYFLPANLWLIISPFVIHISNASLWMLHSLLNFTGKIVRTP